MGQVVNIRFLVLETLLECEKKNIYVKDALNKTLYQNQFLGKQDRAFLSRMVEGITEYQGRLDYVINLYSKTKVSACKPVIRVILRMGVYQMLFMDSVRMEAACDECVKLAKKKGFHNLSGFVNGVLRTIGRNKDCISYPKEEENLSLALSIQYSMPEWIVKKLLEWYGEALTRTILSGCMETKDLTIRINSSKITKDKLIEKLEEKDIKVSEGHYVPEALHLSHINYVLRIPGFKQGEFFVQDESSMLVYRVVEKELQKKVKTCGGKQPLKVLDLCAAPGGKATHFAQNLGKHGQVEARDLTQQKVSLISENIERLGLCNIQVKVADALLPDEERKNYADVVIADLPCSGLGIMGKKNDIKYHVREEQLKELSLLQRNILENAMAYVKPGGILLYCTCTINPMENVENGRWILDHKDFQPFSFSTEVPDSLHKCFVEPNMLQLLQGREQCDGFFISAFRKG